jgi:formylmethanofuran dehydrogenase subunit E
MRAAPIECPHCGEVTMPNRLADGTVVCSCAAARELGRPAPPAPARRTG